MSRCRLRHAAKDDLLDIYLHGLAHFGLPQADAYQASLEKAFAFLAKYPRAARERLEIADPVRVYPCGVHLIIYELDSEGIVDIVRIRHGREDWQSAD